jgi:hypothetical protein
MKDIRGYEGVYAATEDGRIYSHPKLCKGGHKGKYLKPWKMQAGYFVVSLYKEVGKQHKYLIHRLVATEYVPNPRELNEVNHKNGIKTDNRPENLEWCTSKENKAHAWEKGLYTHKGTSHYLAKLDAEKVREIRNSPNDFATRKKLAEKFGVTTGRITDVFEGKTWKHIP